MWFSANQKSFRAWICNSAQIVPFNVFNFCVTMHIVLIVRLGQKKCRTNQKAPWERLSLEKIRIFKIAHFAFFVFLSPSVKKLVIFFFYFSAFYWSKIWWWHLLPSWYLSSKVSKRRFQTVWGIQHASNSLCRPHASPRR